MSEKISRPPAEKFSRRDIIKSAAGFGAVALGGALVKSLYSPAKEAYSKVRSIGDDYSNDPFWRGANAHMIDRARLDELLASGGDTPLYSRYINKNSQINPESFAEYIFMLDKPGPVHAEFEGLRGEGTSLAILKASVDNGEEFFIPLIKDPSDQSPVTVQLGTHEAGPRRLSVSLRHATAAIEPEEIVPHFARGSTGSVRSLIDLYQPDIYPFDYNQLANNFPLRSFVFVYEADEALALVYWKECVGEDKEYGRFGTSVQQLFSTKSRITDYDWDMEALVDKATGRLKLANIAMPYHNRENISTDPAPHTPLRVASGNNNLELVTDERILHRPAIRFRPQPLVHDDRWQVLYSTSPGTARLSACQHIGKGTLNPNNPADAHIIEESDLDINACQN